MEKKILQQILDNPLLPKIKQKLSKFREISDIEFKIRDCKDPKYNEIPTIRFKIQNKRLDDDVRKFYSRALRTVEATCSILDIKNNLTVTYANLDSLNNKENYRNIDIYLKHMSPEQQINTFDNLTQTFNSFLDKLYEWKN